MARHRSRHARRRTTTVGALARCGAAVVLAGGAVPLLGSAPAVGDEAVSVSERGAIGAYYYSLGLDKPDAAPAAPPNVTATATDGVAEGHLAVAVRVPGQDDKISFIGFDLDTLPFDATITRAVMTLPLAPDPGGGDPTKANTQVQPAPAKVRACAAGPEGFNGEDGQSFALAPTFDCAAFSAVATATADGKGYVFDVSGLAATWLTVANNGVALVPAEGADAAPFQVVFLPATDATIAVTATLPSEDVEVVVEEPELPVQGPLAPVGPVVEVPQAPVEPAPVDPVVAPGTGTGTSTGGTTSPATTPVASEMAEQLLRPTAAFWALVLTFAGVLALVARTMSGGASVAAVAAGPRSRLSRALENPTSAPLR